MDLDSTVQAVLAVLSLLSGLLATAQALRKHVEARDYRGALDAVVKAAEPFLDKRSKAAIAVASEAAGVAGKVHEAVERTVHAAGKRHETQSGRLVMDPAAMALVVKWRASLAGERADDLEGLVRKARELEDGSIG